MALLETNTSLVHSCEEEINKYIYQCWLVAGHRDRQKGELECMCTMNVFGTTRYVLRGQLPLLLYVRRWRDTAGKTSHAYKSTTKK